MGQVVPDLIVLYMFNNEKLKIMRGIVFTTYLSIYYCRGVPLNFCYELVAVGDIFIRKIAALSDSSCFIVSLLIHGYSAHTKGCIDLVGIESTWSQVVSIWLVFRVLGLRPFAVWFAFHNFYDVELSFCIT